ncbi:MAG: hypothetical protein F4Z00_13390 [Acidimicrobiaceae bacterium]|nr:hypothetical protein [Acidimicrobiaceae bacterium]MDE0492996.1 hypothetical protein [Acidimicrobiaceae bacterium]MDE0664650.1 hypothetical protein [Acidimicrobiaceae bacterium]MXY12316.1 hypothetical protein [Acidimicrobiaceae bacterium]MXZ66516.1 hypothetical protein [Acidimicrobiaceae bacterium]
MTAPQSIGARRNVPGIRAAVLTYRVLVRQVITPGKLAALGALGALMMLVGWLVGFTAEAERSAAGLLRDGAGYADGFGLIIIVPIVALVFGSSVLGETREDGTLVYLWLRPMGRTPIVAGAAAAAATAALPLTVIPTAVGGWLAANGVDGSADLALAAAAAAALGTAAYSSLFVLLGLLVRKPIMWGLGYVLLWEGLAVGLGDFAARLSLRGYTRSVLSRVADVDYGFEPHTTTTSLVVLAAVSVVGLALAAIRLNRLEVD